MARWISKPKRTVKVQIVGGSLEKRLAKVEQELAEIEERQKQADCICGPFLVMNGPGTAAGLREAMDTPCPAHGFRELSIFHCISVEPSDSGPREIRDPEVDALLEEYYRRLKEARRLREDD